MRMLLGRFSRVCSLLDIQQIWHHDQPSPCAQTKTCIRGHDSLAMLCDNLVRFNGSLCVNAMRPCLEQVTYAGVVKVLWAGA